MSSVLDDHSKYFVAILLLAGNPAVLKSSSCSSNLFSLPNAYVGIIDAKFH